MGTQVADPPKEALDLQEALAERPSPIADDGTVLIHVIRPGIGKGRGRHLYTAEMLQENAHVFGGYTTPDGVEHKGWKMYVDHQSETAKRAAGGLPRSIRELGGRLLESWWDPSVPASGDYGQGAVIGRARPVGIVRKLLEEDPELLEASIRAKATGVRRQVEDGKQVWVVEGIRQSPGTVDWVSEGGAGGRVADLIEALCTDADEDEPAQGGVTDMDLIEALNDSESEVTRKLDEKLGELVEAAIETAVEKVTEDLEEKHKTELQEAREAAREEGQAQARSEVDAEQARKAELQSLHAKAHELIEAAELPEPSTELLRKGYALKDDEPSAKLDVEAEVDGDGKQLRSAEEILVEALTEEIDAQRSLAAALNPTAVSGQGAAAADESAVAKTAEPGQHIELMESAGIDPAEAWDHIATEEAK